jgi:hypothetical protein
MGKYSEGFLTGLKTVIEAIKTIIVGIKDWSVLLLTAVLPVYACLTVSDFLLPTHFGVLKRTLDVLTDIGVKENVLTGVISVCLIIIVIFIVSIINNKNKP